MHNAQNTFLVGLYMDGEPSMSVCRMFSESSNNSVSQETVFLFANGFVIQRGTRDTECAGEGCLANRLLHKHVTCQERSFSA